MTTRARSGIVVAAVVAAAVASAGGCGAKAHRGEPLGPRVVARSDDQIQGERLFFQFCSQCHPGGAGGLGPAINDKPLPAFAIKTQIRAGVGAMPSFGPDQLSDDDLDKITDYIAEMMRTAPTYEVAKRNRKNAGWTGAPL
jgi:mono/diheme cytochrome c family protein